MHTIGMKGYHGNICHFQKGVQTCGLPCNHLTPVARHNSLGYSSHSEMSLLSRMYQRCRGAVGLGCQPASRERLIFITHCTAILIIIEGQLQVFRSKLVLINVESCFMALNYSENGSSKQCTITDDVSLVPYPKHWRITPCKHILE
jgi:hypothetical protein